MKKLTMLMALALAACGGGGGSARPTASVAPSGAQTGAGSAEGAVTLYIDALKARDIQALSAVWGSSSGSVRNTMDRAELEKRGMTLMGLFCPESYKVTGQTAGLEGRRNVQVQMSRATRVVDVVFVTVTAADKRWYVEDIPMPRGGDLPQRLQYFCR